MELTCEVVGGGGDPVPILGPEGRRRGTSRHFYAGRLLVSTKPSFCAVLGAGFRTGGFSRFRRSAHTDGEGQRRTTSPTRPKLVANKVLLLNRASEHETAAHCLVQAPDVESTC